jgi:hypothetical protein
MKLDPGAPQRAPAEDQELLLHGGAGSVPSAPSFEQVRPGLMDQRLDLASLATNDPGDLAVREPGQLRQCQGGPLVLREPADVGDHRLHLRPLLGDLGGAGRERLGGPNGLRATPSQAREARVARDRVQPGAQLDAAITAVQLGIGGGERLLQASSASADELRRLRHKASSPRLWRS